ncbi:uncharacterized protein RJT20DRAFT_3670 [Scheffersomyces xylosifermentans]|uniref:uncharacterized protein n=1 Tax=Scheffersomyces xylosifermentans TaxID=1304137 RepID=UPI00315D72FE
MLEELELDWIDSEFPISNFKLPVSLQTLRLNHCKCSLEGTQFPAQLRTLYVNPPTNEDQYTLTEEQKESLVKELNSSNLSSLEWFHLKVPFGYTFEKGIFSL